MLPGKLPIFSVFYHFIFTENKHGVAKLIRFFKQKWRMLEVQVSEYQTGFSIQKLNIYIPVKQNFSFQFFDRYQVSDN